MVRSRAASPLVAAALLALVLSGCGTSRRGTPGSTPSASTTATPGTRPTPTTPSRYGHPGSPAPAGAGVIDGMSLNGSAAYVEAVDPAVSRVGCEGMPEAVLFRQPLSGGPRELLGAFRGRVLHGRAGRVAVVTGCEGSFSALRVGTETPDGHLKDLRPVTIAPVPGAAGFSPVFFAVAWSADGTRLLVGENPPAEPSPSTRSAVVAAVDPATGATRMVVDTGLRTGVPEGGGAVTAGIGQVGQLADGTYVVAGNGEVSLRDSGGSARSRLPGTSFAIAPDGRRVAVASSSAVALLTPGASPPTSTLVPAQPGRETAVAGFPPDGAVVAYTVSAGGSTDVWLVPTAGGPPTHVAGPGRSGRSSSRATAPPSPSTGSAPRETASSRWCASARSVRLFTDPGRML